MGGCYSEPQDSPDAIDTTSLRPKKNMDETPGTRTEEGSMKTKLQEVVITKTSFIAVSPAVGEFDEEDSSYDEASDDDPTINRELMNRFEECLKKQKIQNIEAAREQFAKLYCRRKIRRRVILLQKLNEEKIQLEEWEEQFKEELREQITKVPPKLQGEAVEPMVTTMFLSFRDEKIETILVLSAESRMEED